MRWPWSKDESSSVTPKESLMSDATMQDAEPTPMQATQTTQSVEATPAQDAEGGIEQRVIETIKTVYDPEIPIDIYELGLIYQVEVRPENAVYVKMTLTSPMCPVAETLPPEVELKVRNVEGVSDVELELVWDPPWDPDMMSEAAKLTLNM
jgi:FeS assembly SUF system protein